MSYLRGLVIGAVLLIALATSATIAVRRYRKPFTLKGAIVQFSDDPSKQSPIAGCEITASADQQTSETNSDFSGFFNLTLPFGIRKGQPVTLTFHRPDYYPLEMSAVVNDDLLIVHMKPMHEVGKADIPVNHPPVTVANIVIRYSVETKSAENIGSGVKIFQVTNTGDVPCNHARVCSPDGQWKAAVASASLDAGVGNEFRDARVSCVAGPCPFTKIDSDNFSSGGRNINVTIRDWSDSTTFVLQAEVFRIQVYDLVRQYYPTIIGRTINFTLPASAGGLSVEAEVNGTPIEFPLGPKPILSWADCSVSSDQAHNTAYRCELKPWSRLK